LGNLITRVKGFQENHLNTVTSTVRVKVKIKFTLEQAMKSLRGSRGIVPLFP
jgi:hypothetical protein